MITVPLHSQGVCDRRRSPYQVALWCPWDPGTPGCAAAYHHGAELTPVLDDCIRPSGGFSRSPAAFQGPVVEPATQTFH